MEREELASLLEIFAKELSKPSREATPYHLERIKIAYVITQKKYRRLTGEFYEPKDLNTTYPLHI